MVAPDEHDPEQLLAGFGRLNFRQPCTVEGRTALLAMNEQNVFLAVADDPGSTTSAGFGDVDVVGDGTARTVTFGGRPWQVSFATDDDAARFVRVLGVRRQATAISPALVGHQARDPLAAAGAARSSRAHDITDAERYRRWSDWALMASTFLLVVGWADLAIGAIAAVVLFLEGTALSALVTLVVTVAGCALPFCLGSLSRVVVIRYRMQDNAVRATAG